MDELWGLALSNLTSTVILGLVFIVFGLVAYILAVKYSSSIFKKKEYGAPGVSKRFLAFILDYLVLNLVAVVFLIIYLFTVPDFRLFMNQYMEERLANNWFLLKYDFRYAQYLILGSYCFYSMVCELSNWQGTFAMYKTELRVVNSRGEKPKPVQLFTRNLLKFGVILYWPFFIALTYTNSRRRWLHDILSRTQVIELKE